jgi:lysyl-tRNA synthetase, class II
VGVGNLVSAATPDVAWRARLLLRLEPVSLGPVLHAAVVPASASLALVSVYLAKRRRRAWRAALVLALSLVPLNVVKGLDVEEAAAALATAALLWWGRDAFRVRHDPASARAALWRIPALAGLVGPLAAGLALLSTPGSAPLGTVLREAGDLLLWRAGPGRFADELALVPLGFGLVELGALALSAYVLFRPLAAPRSLPDARARRLAVELVHRHGNDTLAAFKLRGDVHYLFSPDRGAFLAYRVERGVMLVSGDPVGPAAALPALVRDAVAFAELRGLKLGAVGVGAATVPLFERAGLRAFYLGDEAIVDTHAFSLEGRAIRKVRQSVSRLERCGYRVELRPAGELGSAALAELERVSAGWRAGAPERGFSMALDTLRGDGALVLARDSEGVVRGLLHFVPTYGRAAASLSAMRRDRGTPNGLMEFLVARGIDLLRAHAVEEVSLNFAAFARLLREPRNRRERLLRRLLAVGDRFFQIERLLRFNAKFFPRWEPRFVLYQGALGLARTGLASLLAEGQLARPRLPRSAWRVVSARGD